MKMEQIECSETSAYKIQAPGNHLEENIQHMEHGEILKSKISIMYLQPRNNTLQVYLLPDSLHVKTKRHLCLL
jgi:hypothetical protein